MPLAGRAIYALRFQAVIFGVLAVPVCAALARRLGGPLAGLIAAALLALSPFHIWWSQQTRMYALVALLCALSMYLLLKALSTPHTALPRFPVQGSGQTLNSEPRTQNSGLRTQHPDLRTQDSALSTQHSALGTLVPLGLVNLAGLYTLYFFAVLILLEGLLIAWCWLRPKPMARPALLVGFVSCLLPVALLLPWLAYYRQHAIRFAGPDGPAPLTWLQFLQASWGELTLGIDAGVQAYAPLLLTLAVVAVLLVASLLIRDPKLETRNSKLETRSLVLWLVLVAAGLPLAAYGITLQRGLFFSPTYQTRYDLPALPALVVLLAWAISRLPALPRLVPLAMLAGVAIFSLPRLYDARHRTDDYQSLARFVEAYQRPGDAIIFDPDWNFHLFLLDYYGRLPWQAIPLNQPVDGAYVDQQFSRWSAQYPGLWLLQEAGGHDAAAQHPVRDWLEAHLRSTLQLSVGDRLLTLYQPAGAAPRSLNLTLQPRVQLTAVPGVTGFDQPLWEVRPGDVLNVAVYGDSPCHVERSETSVPCEPGGDSLRFARGQASLDAQNDKGVLQLTLAGRTFPGRVLPGQRDFSIPIGAWAPAGQQPIQALLADGRQVPLSSVYIEPRASAAGPSGPPLANVVERGFGGLALLTSYQLEPPQPNPGQDLFVRLQWQALQPFSANYTVFVHLLDAADHVVAQRDSQPHGGQLPTVAWQPGQTVDDSYLIPLPAGLSAGRYRLELGMYLQSTGQRLPLSDEPSADHLILGTVSIPSPSGRGSG